MFSLTDRMGMIPYRRLSSESMTIPLRMLCSTLLMLTSRPLMYTCPAAMGSSPKSDRITSVLPAPISPAKPTISPFRTWKLTFWYPPAPLKFSTFSSVSPISTSSFG